MEGVINDELFGLDCLLNLLITVNKRTNTSCGTLYSVKLLSIMVARTRFGNLVRFQVLYVFICRGLLEYI